METKSALHTMNSISEKAKSKEQQKKKRAETNKTMRSAQINKWK